MCGRARGPWCPYLKPPQQREHVAQRRQCSDKSQAHQVISLVRWGRLKLPPFYESIRCASSKLAQRKKDITRVLCAQGTGRCVR